MKTGTILALAVGAAAVLYFVMRPGGLASPKGSAATGVQKPPVTSTGNRDLAVRTGIDLAAKGGGMLIDWLNSPSSTPDYGNGTGTSSPDLVAPEGWL